jgi:DMSO reductase anchor subunit
MLTLLPAAVGLTCAAALLRPHQSESITYWVTLSSWLTGLSGLSASVFHLGQPMRAWRIFLGWRKSWLSREAMIFGAWMPLASAAILFPDLLVPSAITGLIGLGCSAMIYIDTRRHFWRTAQTVPRFFGTAALLAVAPFAPLLAAAMLGMKVAWESRTFFDQSVSARLQRGPLRKEVLVRDSLATLGIVLLVVSPGWLALTVVLTGEIAERYLFYRAVDAPKMPGMAA